MSAADEARPDPGTGQLERRYRRLLAWYPWEHRRQYEDEMLDVLLAGARPGQRRPDVADILDVLAAAGRARVCRTTSNMADLRWADAASIAGLLAAIAMVTLHLRIVAHTYALDLADVAGLQVLGYAYVRPAAVWAVVVVVALAGFRRTAAVLAWLAVAYDAAPVLTSAGFPPSARTGVIWPLAIGLLAAASMSVPARSGRSLLGWRRLTLVGLACTVGVVASALNTATMQAGVTRPLVWDLRPAELVGFGFASATVLLAAAVGTLDQALRRRVLAAFAPVAVLLALRHSVLGVPLFRFGTFSDALALEPVQWLVVLVAPVLAFAVAAAAVHWREQRQRLLELGRRADRATAPVG